MRHLLLVVLTFFVLGAKQAGQTRQADVARNAAIVGCFATQDWVMAELKEIGLAVGANAEVVLHFGSILNTSPSNSDDFQVMFYSADRTRAWLGLGQYDSAGRITMRHNGYRLMKDGARWDASEGNGGVVTYAAVGAHAARLDSRSKTRIPLVAKPGGACSVS